MRLDELMKEAGLFFEEERADYFVFGATAMNFWIPPRNTVDLDAVVCADRRRAGSLLARLKTRGFPIRKDLIQKFREGRIIKIPLGDTELDLKLGRSRHEQTALQRAKRFDADDYRLWISVPEDLVLFKLQSWRRQDQADIERMVQLRSDLDLAYIGSWLEPITVDTGHPLKLRWEEFRAT